jgi:2-isopropylmalate synthase
MPGTDSKSRVLVYDTTLRDGSQGEGISFSLQDKLMIAARLDELGVDYIEGGYPLSNPKDKAFFDEVRNLKLRHARPVAFGNTRKGSAKVEDDPSVNAVLAAGTPTTCIFGKTWDFHVREALRVSLDENLRMIADSVGHLKRAGREVVYDCEHFFDGWKANPEYALKTVLAAREAGADWIVLCDTNGGSLPDEVYAIAREVLPHVGEGRLGIHTHNDGDLGVANTLAAVRAGATQVQGTINGIGERCGNADLISVVANLRLKMKRDCLSADGLPRLTELSRFVYDIANMNWRDNQPFTGASAFAHKAGVHAHAVARDARTYEHIDPGLVGNDRRILISELSGASNVAVKLAAMGIAEPDRALMRKVLDEVVRLENEGWQFEAADASFELLLRRHLGRHREFFRLDHYRASVYKRDGAAPVTECTLKLHVGDKSEHTVAEGDGPVNALDAAVRKALEPHFPAVRGISLVDYKVRVINSKAATAAKVRVTIETRDRDWSGAAGDGVYGTVGVSENILDASFQALRDAIEYKLLRDEERRRGEVQHEAGWV